MFFVLFFAILKESAANTKSSLTRLNQPAWLDLRTNNSAYGEVRVGQVMITVPDIDKVITDVDKVITIECWLSTVRRTGVVQIKVSSECTRPIKLNELATKNLLKLFW